jgi:hypothetical protein
MLLSRFWYVLLGLLIGALVFVLFLAQSMYNRQGSLAMAEGLSSDSQVVSWYLKNDARERSAHLIKFAVENSIGKGLSESNGNDAKVPDKVRASVLNGLTKVAATIPKDQAFDAVFAVDQHGRVVAHLGYEQASGMQDFELGGYPVVADALHGFVRDDTLVLDRVYRVVARPVEYDLGQQPAGAIVGARIIDDRFARDLSTRTGAAVAFHARGQRVASGAPEGFDRGKLDMIVSDLKDVEADEDYKTKGKSALRVINKSLGVVYGRLPGEAWDLGAGYVVGRDVAYIDNPLAFFSAADDKDKAGAKIGIVAGIAAVAMLVGLLLTWLEHSKPLAIFRTDARKLAKGEAEALQPSKFRGSYRTLASDINDGIDVAAGKQGGNRRAADLQQVLGDLPAEPQMSAFSFPGDGPAASPKAKLPSPKGAPSSARITPVGRPPEDDGVVSSVGFAPSAQAAAASEPERRLPAPPRRPGGSTPQASAPQASAPQASAPGNEGQNVEWVRVFEQFAATKQQCGEALDGFTFEKFQNTLRKHRDAIIERHGVKRVKFSVYVKDGKAALKASPIKE